jgi:hypothetical protein
LVLGFICSFTRNTHILTIIAWFRLSRWIIESLNDRHRYDHKT